MSESTDSRDIGETTETVMENSNYGDPSPLWFDVELEKDSNGIFGFFFGGGSDGSVFGRKIPGTFIQHIIPDSPAERSGKLQIGDRIISIDGTDLQDFKIPKVDRIIRDWGMDQKSVKLGIERCPLVHEVVVKRDGVLYDQDLGVSLTAADGSPIDPEDHRDCRVFIREVEEGSIAETAGLKVGQQLIAINGQTIFQANKSQLKVLLNWGQALRFLVAEPGSLLSRPLPNARRGRNRSNRKLVDLRFFGDLDQFGLSVTITKDYLGIFLYLFTWLFIPTLIFSTLVRCISFLYSFYLTSCMHAMIVQQITYDQTYITGHGTGKNKVISAW